MDHETLKHTLDGASVVTVIATIAQWLPPIAAFFSIVWTGMRIIEMLVGEPFHIWWKGRHESSTKKG